MNPRISIILAAAALLSACATGATDFPQPTAAWKTDAGQLQYVSAERPVIGEFTAAHLGRDLRFEFSKGGALPLLRLARTGDTLRAEGPLARGKWEGPASSAPAHLAGWVRVSSALIGSSAKRGASLTVAGLQAGERFNLHFNR